MVTRTETTPAEQDALAFESISAEIKSADLCKAKVYEILGKVKGLEKSLQQPAVAELATRLSLKYIADAIIFYPEFEDVLRAHFMEKDDPETQLCTAISICRVGADTMLLYYDHLRNMFEASGKTLQEFYGDMAVEAGVQEDLDSPDFGEKALDFYEKVRWSVHMEHLLVFYLVRLLLKLYKTDSPESCPSVSERRLERLCVYFERGFPLEPSFCRYTKDDTFIHHRLGHALLSEI